MGHTAVSATKASSVTLRFSNEAVMNYGNVILQISSFSCLFLAKTFPCNIQRNVSANFVGNFLIFFLFFCSNHRLWVHDRTASPKCFQRVPAIYVLEQK